MKEKFADKLGLNKTNTVQLNTINEILEDYKSQGYVLTLRQLYYQLVTKAIIPNEPKEYSKLSTLLRKGRMAGIVDWASIEDRGRSPKLDFSVDDIPEALDIIADQYKLDRMRGQPKYIEVWVEKDALSSIFRRVTDKYHVRLMVNKGYSSCSAMYEAAKRFKQYGGGGESVLIYCGDHDPSGKDMVRDIRDRLIEFKVEDLIVLNPALTMDQVRKYNPPENPAKIDDPRAKWYIEQYGDHSWELDALTPSVLVEIVEKAIKEHVDLTRYESMLRREKMQKAEITSIAEEYRNK